MQRAKAFLLVCAGVCLLALSYYLGAQNAVAAQPKPSERPTAVALVVYPDAQGVSQLYALASNGDVYHVTDRTGEWSKYSNMFSSFPPAKLPWSEMPQGRPR